MVRSSSRQSKRPRHLDDYNDAELDLPSAGRLPKRKKRGPVSQSSVVWLQETVGWAIAEHLVQRWDATADACISKLSCCSCCGTVKFGSPNAKLPDGWKRHVLESPPAYSFANPGLLSYMGDFENNSWIMCKNCSSGQGYRHTKVSFVGQEMQHCLAQLPPVLLQSFSCVDTSVQIQQKYGTVAEGDPSQGSILHSPLVSNAVLNATEEQQQLLADLLADFVANNPIINKHLTAWEMVDCLGGSPILTSSVVQNITQQARERGPLNEYQDLQQHFPTSLLEDLNETPAVQYGTTVKLGQAQLRSTPGEMQPCTTKNLSELQNSTASIEDLMFPYMFPDGNTYKGSGSFSAYAKMRMEQSFSLQTAFPQYVFHLYQISKALSFKNSVQVCLDQEYSSFLRSNPHASQQEVFNNMLKDKLPPQLNGSPAFFKAQLKNLQAMVRQYGMPTLFLTLTADEVSATKWTECSQAQALFSEVLNKPVSAYDMPVENARIFMHRFDNFMKDYILGGSRILGEVQQFVHRFELQGRGSLHAHCMLWMQTRTSGL